MAQQTWQQLLNAGAPWQTTVGASLTTATTATISPQSAGGNDYTLQANYLYPGLAIRVTARGYITTTATSTTATWFLAANQNGTYTTLATSAGLATGTTAYTALPWKLDGLIQIVSIGSSGNTVSTQAELEISQNSATAQTVNTGSASVTLFMPASSPPTTVALNTTVATAFPLRATLGGANATIVCTQYLLESLD